MNAPTLNALGTYIAPPKPAPRKYERAFTVSIASETLEAIIERGSRELIHDPHRATYVIRRARELSPRELELACNRWLEHCADMNRAIGFLQLRRAACTPEFAVAWREYQIEMGAVS